MYLDEFQFNTPKLLIFYLGGNLLKTQIEMHDVAFVVAKNDQEASEKIRSKWCGTEKSLHVDSWFAAEEVDGYEIKLGTTPPPTSSIHLYFVNLGFYQKGVFGESHFITLTVAGSKIEAMEKAKNKCFKDLEMLHSDNIYDLDDCIRIDEVDQHYLELQYTGKQGNPIIPINGYQKLREQTQSFALTDKNL